MFGAEVPTRFEKGLYEAKAPALLRKLRRLGDARARPVDFVRPKDVKFD